MTLLDLLVLLAASGYVFAVSLLAIYGVHSIWLLNLFLRHRAGAVGTEQQEHETPLTGEHPRVLVQLPTYNERDVVERLVNACSRLEWPKDRLHIQLLDDSTDDSLAIGEGAIAKLREQGFAATLVHREDRTGYKAGALEYGMAQDAAACPFIAIFDADFVPTPDFLKRSIPPLVKDPTLALVQGRWDHLNREHNLLTRVQSLGIDAHFAVEQGARAWSGLAMNFNGTCGVWRREAIIDAGGWEHDTLTEDMDLSYRAQLRGWHCTYRLSLAVPGEVPATISAWRSQQFRWAKGSIQTAIKLLPRVWNSSWSFHRKVAATLHMTHYLVHPLILLSLLCAPVALTLAPSIPTWVLTLGGISFVVGALSPIVVYIVSQHVLCPRAEAWRRLRILPVLAAIGTGIAVSNARAVWQAITGQTSAFVRTPKQGSGTGSYRARTHTGVPELICSLWAAAGFVIGIQQAAHLWIAPLLLIYCSGFLWIAVLSLREHLRNRRPPVSDPTAAEAATA